MGSLVRTRLVAGGAALVTVGAGLGIRGVGAGTGAVAKYGGDALYTVLVYTLVVLVAPRVRPLVAGAVALGFSWAVELLQLTSVPAELAARSVLARLVLGSTFNAPDLLWYAVGALCAGLVHAGMVRRGAARSPGAPAAPGIRRGVAGGRSPGP
ncbi:ribosomal maturation YjgA family protein [Streptomyces sp. NPDC055036]